MSPEKGNGLLTIIRETVAETGQKPDSLTPQIGMEHPLVSSVLLLHPGPLWKVEAYN